MLLSEQLAVGKEWDVKRMSRRILGIFQATVLRNGRFYSTKYPSLQFAQLRYGNFQGKDLKQPEKVPIIVINPNNRILETSIISDREWMPIGQASGIAFYRGEWHLISQENYSGNHHRNGNMPLTEINKLVNSDEYPWLNPFSDIGEVYWSDAHFYWNVLRDDEPAVIE